MLWVFKVPRDQVGGKLTLQTPQATVHSSLVALAWLAWHSIQRSMMWLRQIAQLSTTMSVKEIQIVKSPQWTSLEDPDPGSFSWLWLIKWFPIRSLTPSPQSNSVPLKANKRNEISQREVSVTALSNEIARKWNVIEIQTKNFPRFLPSSLRISSYLPWLQLRTMAPDPYHHRRCPF